jgi:hypothetical protein
MRRRSVVLAIAIVGGALLVASLAVAADGKKNLKSGALSGYEENPDVSSVATGSFKITIDDAAQTLAYELSYSGLEAAVQQAHIHFAKPAVNGGITLFLCTNLANGPVGTPPCPQSGTVARTVGAAEIVAPAVAGTPQGIEAGNFAELAEALRAGHTYANVHSLKWPAGEIRAQINERR